MKRTLAGLVLVIASLSVTALEGGQTLGPRKDLRFDRLTAKNGLSHNSVRSVMQDRKGFMWFGTQDGLSRYDGYSFHNFRHDPADPGSLGNNSVFSLAEDTDGSLWLGTMGGLDRFEPSSERFRHFRHDPHDPKSLSSDVITYIQLSRQYPGVLWVATMTRGLNRFDIRTGQAVRYIHQAGEPNSLLSNDISSVLEDRAGRVWVATDKGLSRLDPASGSFKHYPARQSPADASGSVGIICLLEDGSGKLWAGTMRGLYSLDRTRSVLEPCRGVPQRPDGLVNAPVRSMAEDADGSLWLVANNEGLLHWYPGTNSLLQFKNEPDNPDSLSYDTLFCLAFDRSGILWAGSYTQGVNKIDWRRNRFDLHRKDAHEPLSLSSNIIKAVYEDRGGGLWVGTWSGLDLMDRKTGLCTHYRHDPRNTRSLSNNMIMAIIEDAAGTLWVGTTNGLNRFDRPSGRFERIFSDPLQTITTYSPIGVTTFFNDRSGILWIGTRQGLLRYNPRDGSRVRYRHPEATPPLEDDDIIWSIFGDSEGRLWLGTGGGLDLFDQGRGTFKNILRSTRDLKSSGLITFSDIRETRAQPGILWIATLGEGLVRYEVRTGELRTYQERNGLPNNTVYKLLEDPQGRLWMSTNSGLSRFDPRTQRFKNYDTRDGVQGDEFNRNCFLSPRGEMFFGGQEGFNSFFPEKIQDDPYVPPVFITDLKVFNKSVPIGSEGGGRRVLEKSILETSEVVLSYLDSVFTLDFSALSFSIPEKNRYAYKLEGVDKDWIVTDALRRSATYTRLQGGTYIFKVKASNSDEVWNEKGISLKIIIKPPLWKTWWAYAAYILLALGGITGYVRFRINVHRRRQERRLFREKERIRHQEIELRAQAMEAEARALKSENERKEIELQKSRELEAAYKDLKDTQQQLIQSERLASLGQLTAGIAHEIKNPLNFVTNFAELSLALSEEIRELLMKNRERLTGEAMAAGEEILGTMEQNLIKIAEHGKRADSIVQGMLLHSRGKPGERQLTELNGLLAEYSTLAYHGLRARDQSFNVKIETEFDPEVGQVSIVPQDLSRAFLNIVNNACYAAFEKKKKASAEFAPLVRIRTKSLGESIEIRIWDNGPGIPASVLDKIYNPFFTTKPAGAGTGLGLYLSYDIVTGRHKGKIRVETQEGEFTEFILTIPRNISGI